MGLSTGNEQVYSDETSSITVKNSSGTNYLPPYKPTSNGSVSLSGYQINTSLGKLNTTSTVYIGIADEEESGYLGRDSLQQLTSGSISLDLSSVDSHYKSYTVRYSNVYVNHSEGNYYVTVDGKESVAIPVTDVEQKPY